MPGGAPSTAPISSAWSNDLEPENDSLTTRADGAPLVEILEFGIVKMVEEATAATTATRPDPGERARRAGGGRAGAGNIVSAVR